jgi:hypothetical protein
MGDKTKVKTIKVYQTYKVINTIYIYSIIIEIYY